MIEFLNERLPMGQRVTAVGLDEAALALLATAAPAAATAAPAAGAVAAPIAAEVAAPIAAEVAAPIAAEGAAALSPEVADMGMGQLPQGDVPEPYTPSADKHLSEIPPAGNEDWGAMAESLDTQMAEGQPKAPTDWREQFKIAQGAFKMGGLLTKNKKDKQTLAGLEMISGLSAADSPESTMKAMQGPLDSIAGATQQQDKHLSEVPPESAPQAPQQPYTPQPQGAAMPATSMGGAGAMGMADRLKMLRGY